MAVQNLVRFGRPPSQRPAAPKPHIGRRTFTTDSFPTAKLAYRVELYLGGSWTDVTAYVYVRNAIRITRGRPDGAIQSQPATLSFTADNRDGRWCATYALGAWYGLLRKGTKVRVCIDHGAGLFERITADLAALPPRWDVSESDRYVSVSASGVLRRLGRGQVAQSAMRRAVLASSPTAYWSLEDSTGATQAGSGLNGGTSLNFLGLVRMGATLAAAGVLSGCSLTAGTTLYGPTGITAGVSTSWEVEMVVEFDPLPTGNLVGNRYTVGRIQTPGGSVTEVGITVASGVFVLGEYNLGVNYIDGTGQHNRYDSSALTAGRTYHLRALYEQSAAGVIRRSLYLNGVLSFTDTTELTGTLYAPTFLSFNDPMPGDADPSANPLISSVAFYAPARSSAATYQARDGYLNEQAHARFTRRCTEEDIAATTSAAVSQAMGPQSAARLPTLLNECEEADSGSVFDGRSGSLIFQSLDERYNLPVALALDHNLGHVAPDFQPTDDDQRIVNDFTASRTSGSSARIEDSTSRMGTDPDIGVGRYDDARSFNLGADTQLPDRAGWQVHLGTVEGLRFPSLSLNFARTPELIDAWLACDIGSRVTLSNPPPGMPTDLIDVIVEGYTETIGPWLWRVDLNCSPYQPYRVGVLAADTGDTDPFLGHLDWDTCVLSATLTTTTNSVSVTTTPLITTTADDFPFDVVIGGERMTVTNCVGAANPQALTVTRSVNTVVKTHPAGAVVEPHPNSALWLGL